MMAYLHHWLYEPTVLISSSYPFLWSGHSCSYGFILVYPIHLPPFLSAWENKELHWVLGIHTHWTLSLHPDICWTDRWNTSGWKIHTKKDLLRCGASQGYGHGWEGSSSLVSLVTLVTEINTILSSLIYTMKLIVINSWHFKKCK